MTDWTVEISKAGVGHAGNVGWITVARSSRRIYVGAKMTEPDHTNEPARLTDHDAPACAAIMATSEPWITLGRDYDASLAIVRDPSREVYVVRDERGVAGFVILWMTGAFVGYIQSIAVREDVRGRGIGSTLIAFAERRIFRESPNVFICVSSFNDRVRQLYARLGYETIGELRDYIARGHSEWLLRKTIGPIANFQPPR